MKSILEFLDEKPSNFISFPYFNVIVANEILNSYVHIKIENCFTIRLVSLGEDSSLTIMKNCDTFVSDYLFFHISKEDGVIRENKNEQNYILKLVNLKGNVYNILCYININIHKLNDILNYFARYEYNRENQDELYYDTYLKIGDVSSYCTYNSNQLICHNDRYIIVEPDDVELFYSMIHKIRKVEKQNHKKTMYMCQLLSFSQTYQKRDSFVDVNSTTNVLNELRNIDMSMIVIPINSIDTFEVMNFLPITIKFQKSEKTKQTALIIDTNNENYPHKISVYHFCIGLSDCYENNMYYILRYYRDNLYILSLIYDRNERYHIFDIVISRDNAKRLIPYADEFRKYRILRSNIKQDSYLLISPENIHFLVTSKLYIDNLERQNVLLDNLKIRILESKMCKEDKGYLKFRKILRKEFRDILKGEVDKNTQ